MGFFLLRRDGDAVTLITPTVFDSRHEALAEVSRASAEGALDADEIFVIDLDAATQVLIVSPPPPAPEPEAPEPPEPFAEEEVPAVDAPGDGDEAMVPAAPVELVEAPIAAAILAAAEAASPESVAADEPEEAEEPGQSEHPVTPQPGPIAEAVSRAWPWEPVPAPMDDPEAYAEPQAETDDAVDEADAPGDEEEPDCDSTSDQEEPGELPAEVSGLLADLDELVPTPPAEDSDEAEPDELEEAEVSGPVTEPEALLESGDEDHELTAEPAVPKAYEAGASDITTMTCEDCIYLNTCPKKGESDPTSCGSFQWKSV
jgi:hypothetical protein